MKSFNNDSHPLMIKLREVLPQYSNNGANYIFLLPPVFALHDSSLDPTDYLFFSTSKSLNWVRHKDKMMSFVIDNDEIVCKGNRLRVLKVSPCTYTNGFSFSVYEIINDIYHRVPIPGIMMPIHESYDDPQKAQLLLSKGLDSPELRAFLSKISQGLYVANVDSTNCHDVVQNVVDIIAQCCDLVFKNKCLDELPSTSKTEVNYLVYNAITAKIHTKCLKAYSVAYEKENSKAQKGMQKVKVNIDITSLEKAARCFQNVFLKLYPMDLIKSVVSFFDTVVEGLPSENAAADDILPAICYAMTKDLNFASCVVSFFTYLTDIWPPYGLDERITYILTTCSIAASHLSLLADAPEKPAKVPEPDETIGLLENLLASF